ncbi:HK97-gp10 family putative phage morphogenesis protein [Sphingobium sp. KCTC 72723]|uniref:HK97-gp10 family putative phage morphogenesis protein n=1 Tax=Sphingobium sp. KCTC 72723 TaxID=2733867 RepID=UPI00165D5FF0|nr:HK97-gp10 family putative phage morphogenesis protein [Sphingobium sp. KCTC 72723]
MSVKGFDEAINHLDAVLMKMENAPQDAAKAWLEQDFKPYAKQIAPVLSGELRDSIDGRVTPSGVEVFATAPHARYVQEGTSTMPANPFMDVAWGATIHKLYERVNKALRKAMR